MHVSEHWCNVMRNKQALNQKIAHHFICLRITARMKRPQPYWMMRLALTRGDHPLFRFVLQSAIETVHDEEIVRMKGRVRFEQGSHLDDVWMRQDMKKIDLDGEIDSGLNSLGFGSIRQHQVFHGVSSFSISCTPLGNVLVHPRRRIIVRLVSFRRWSRRLCCRLLLKMRVGLDGRRWVFHSCFRHVRCFC